MEGVERNEGPSQLEKEIFDLRCRIQYLIIVLMLKTGVIQHEIEYVKFAPVFDMMTRGALSIDPDLDWKEIRKKTNSIIAATQEVT